MLRTQLHFSIVTMPQKISKRGVGLTEISEEQEDEMEEEAGGMHGFVARLDVPV